MDYRQLDRQEYTKIMQSYPEKRFPIEQSPEWGAFQTQVPGRLYLGTFLLKNNEQEVGTVSLLQLTMRGYSYIWANQGPVWLVSPTQSLVNDAAQAVRRIVRDTCAQAKPLFIRTHSPLPPTRSVEAYSKSLIEKTTIVNLAQNFDDVLAAMSQGARRGMRKAQKAGVEVREVPASEAAANFTSYYDILRETATRDGYFIHPASTYQAMLTSLGTHVRFFVGFMNGKPATWAMDTTYNQHGVYYYGASNSEARDAMAPYLLHIEIMRQLQSEGIKSYDFLGIGSKKFPGLEGVTQFKLRFGGDVVDYTPIYDLPLRPHYQPWKWAQAIKQKLRRH